MTKEEKELIETLVRKRKTMGMTQGKLAELAGIKQPAIARMESLSVNPTLNTLIKVTNAMQVKLEIVPKSSR